MPPLFNRLIIVGVGLIGGSLGLAAQGRGLVGEVVGFGRTEANLKIALERGIINSYTFDPAEAACGADLLLLAVPVEATRSTIEKFIPFLPSGCIITDAGSTKEQVVRTLEQALPPSLPCVGAHPIAGTEHAGAAAAFATLFEKRLCVLTPTERTDKTALARVRALWEGVGMRVEEMDMGTHDRVLGRVSHLPHLIAFSVMNALLDASVPGIDLLTYAGSAFADLTRVAASPVEMWRDICTSNRDALLVAIEEFAEALSFMKLCVAQGDSAGLEKAINRARAERQRLTKIREQS
ncbi:MAG: prephenate dehydrogenase/arogenate dehydrogenase family protein [Deltaproteobacteria bacterium]|nr:prephenate dehydrogenase/arogenate dehydrogenase family protein [Deltaproteobacteria bacterium]